MIPIPWFNADDKMHGHPKVRKAGLNAIGLWTVCGTYCTDFLTDGLVPLWYIQTWPNGTKLANHLFQTGFWEEAPDGDYQFLSWDEYQRTRTKVIAEREKARMRKQKWRDEHPDASI